MSLGKLNLQDFRNFDSKTFDFSGTITILVGDNAVGKTNTLEAIFFLSTGKSFKANKETEVIAYGENVASITGITSTTRLEAKITTGDNGWPRKKLLVNGVPKRLIDFVGNFKTVLFGPWDMDLVTSSPSLRRRFLDTVLSQTDREYRRSIISYEKGLRQRNKVLWRIREDPSTRFAHSGRSMLAFWNQLLIKNGDYISRSRREFIEFANNDSFQLDGIAMRAISNFQLEYNPSTISEGRLEQYKNEEIAAATTLVGPHRDDFRIVAKSQMANDKLQIEGTRDLAKFGSRGEQRMAVLWLKMKELDYVEQSVSRWDHSTPSGRSGWTYRPTLLLDDIFSELDHEHRDMVMELAKKQQTIITTADEHFVGKNQKNVDTIRI